MQYQDVSQEKVAANRGYATQSLFHDGWSGWRGKNKILKM